MRALAARLCAGTEHHSAVETNEQSCSAQRGLAAEDNRSIDSVDVASIPFGQDYCSAGQDAQNVVVSFRRRAGVPKA
jgi:hypothetical protein